mmetsp:Transcript_29119/g.53122  ORF Transcript_29119/g.53122 Transcript_29119/m.53122 type:complete len:219 (+) Transcript_29119:342-998(+)
MSCMSLRAVGAKRKSKPSKLTAVSAASGLPCIIASFATPNGVPSSVTLVTPSRWMPGQASTGISSGILMLPTMKSKSTTSGTTGSKARTASSGKTRSFNARLDVPRETNRECERPLTKFTFNATFCRAGGGTTSLSVRGSCGAGSGTTSLSVRGSSVACLTAPSSCSTTCGTASLSPRTACAMTRSTTSPCPRVATSLASCKACPSGSLCCALPLSPT